tara:strand:- start:1276 stop:3366 length:2091 start_codon:yes stop_codon:yes gene_type:complete
MAYKFQLGSATLSGSLTQEGNIVAAGGGSLVASEGNVSGSGNLMIGGTVALDGVADASADLTADSFYFLDGDGLMKREAMADYATSAAGDGLKAANGAFALDLNELSAAAVNVGADSIAIVDADDNLSKKESIADLMTATAGDALAASSGVLAVQVNSTSLQIASDEIQLKASVAGDGLALGSHVLSVNVDDSSIEIDSDSLRLKDDGVTGAKLAPAVAGLGLGQDGSGNLDVQTSGAILIASDKLGITGSFAGPGLAYRGGVDSINEIELDLSEFNAVTPAASDSFLTLDSDGSTEQRTTTDALATLFAGDGLAAASAVMKLDLNELTAATVDVANDSLAIVDANDSNATRKESIADLVNAMVASTDGLQASSGVISVNANSTSFEFDAGELQLKASVAGDGLALGSEVLSVNVDDSTIEIDSDSLRLKDDGVTGAKLAPAVAGLGLAQDGSGNLDVQTSGAIKIASDKLGISGSFAGPGIKYNGGADSINDIEIDIAEFSAVTPAASDSFLTLDSDGSTEQRTTTDALATLFAGNGLSAASAVMALDLNELSAAAVDVANDSIAIIDANDSNGSKKESIADLVTGMAGSGLTATSGVLSVTANNVAAKSDGDTLVEGYNYFATVSGASTVTLPASPAVGDVITVKAKDGVSTSNYIQINRAGSQTIDGETSVRIESPYGAIAMVYVANNDWRIV